MKQLLVFSICLLGLSEGCTPAMPSSQENNRTAYFSLSEVIDRQAEVLAARRAVSIKVVQAGDRQPDTLARQVPDWAEELRLFKEADINKPAWIGEYEISQTADGVSYRAAKASQPVRLLTVKGTSENPVSVEAHMVQSNLLYHTEKHFRLDFGKNGLIAYRIEGFRKALFSDTTKYLLAAAVR